MKFQIPAEVHTDDHKIEVKFDAEPYFQQASDKEIHALVEIDFGGDYAADGVAEYLSDSHGQIARLFEYLKIVNADAAETTGFEVHIESGPALAWIKKNRPHLT